MAMAMATMMMMVMMLIRYNNFVREKQGKVADGISRRLMEKQRQVSSSPSYRHHRQVRSGKPPCSKTSVSYQVYPNLNSDGPNVVNGTIGINVADKSEGESCKGGSREGLAEGSVVLNFHRRHGHRYHRYHCDHYHHHHHVTAPVTIHLFREAKQRLNVAVEDRRLFRFN